VLAPFAIGCKCGDMGILVPDDNNDIDLSEYIIDSLQFISFIVEIENKFGIEIPDELLNIENLKSLNGFSQLIENILGENN